MFIILRIVTEFTKFNTKRLSSSTQQLRNPNFDFFVRCIHLYNQSGVIYTGSIQRGHIDTIVEVSVCVEIEVS